jgi:putative glutamine amidotransferase
VPVPLHLRRNLGSNDRHSQTDHGDVRYRFAMAHPVIGITADNRDNTAASGTYTCAIAYSRAVAAAGGTPVMLPHEPERLEQYLSVCDGFVLTGGVDPDTRPFGAPLHPEARVMDPQRQAFETALLRALRPATPCLGVCLGMQLMALCAGGELDQHMPDHLPTHADHYANAQHGLVVREQAQAWPCTSFEGAVTSHHRQAVARPGTMRILATAPDGVVEAIDDPDRPFYLGLQWHPERSAEPSVSSAVFEALVAAARRGK